MRKFRKMKFLQRPFFALILSIGLVACGGSGDGNNSPQITPTADQIKKIGITGAAALIIASPQGINTGIQKAIFAVGDPETSP